jgi:hypothetical protein
MLLSLLPHLGSTSQTSKIFEFVSRVKSNFDQLVFENIVGDPQRIVSVDRGIIIAQHLVSPKSLQAQVKFPGFQSFLWPKSELFDRPFRHVPTQIHFSQPGFPPARAGRISDRV